MLVEEIEQVRAFIKYEKYLWQANKSATQLCKKAISFSLTFLPKLPKEMKCIRALTLQTSVLGFLVFLGAYPSEKLDQVYGMLCKCYFTTKLHMYNYTLYSEYKHFLILKKPMNFLVLFLK